MIKFYKDTTGKWIIGPHTVPAGFSRSTDNPDGTITIKCLLDPSIEFSHVNKTDFANSAGVPYADAAAYDAATSGFFVKASATEASQTSTGLMSAADKKKLDSLSAPILNNMSATAPPAVTDDTTKGFSASSIWVYSGATYTCTDATEGKAVWVSSTNMYYFDTWAQLVASISVAGSTYVGKHCSVANANGAPSSGLTYVAPTPVDTIVDGGEAVLLVNAQGTNYSVTCQPRTVKNPIITSVMLTAAAKPTVKGYYIFTVTPTDGLPTGISLNDIAYFDGAVWSVYQKYTKADTVLVANTGSGVQVTWRKFNGTWMSTADEYIPDGNEYQTGKLWNGKAVFRKCYSGTLNGATSQTISADGSIPRTGSILMVMGTFYRSTGTVVTVYPQVSFAVNYYGGVFVTNSDGSGNNGTFTVWVEYTKS